MQEGRYGRRCFLTVRRYPRGIQQSPCCQERRIGVRLNLRAESEIHKCKCWLLNRPLIGWILLIVFLGAPAWAESETSPTQPFMDKAIEQYLLSHPEVIEQALKSLDVKRQEEQQRRIKQTIAGLHKQLLEDPDSPVSGNASWDITVIEFFDYQCGYCKQVASSVTQLQRDDSNVRVAYKDFPILGDASVFAARAALAAQMQGKHQVFHEALLSSKLNLTKEEVLSIAERVGLDRKRLEVDMRLPKWDDLIERNRTLAGALTISGTPGFIVGGELHVGALGLEGLKQLVAKARGR